jgi:hypothetical protein
LTYVVEPSGIVGHSVVRRRDVPHLAAVRLLVLDRRPGSPFAHRPAPHDQIREDAQPGQQDDEGAPSGLAHTGARRRGHMSRMIAITNQNHATNIMNQKMQTITSHRLIAYSFVRTGGTPLAAAPDMSGRAGPDCSPTSNGQGRIEGRWDAYRRSPDRGEPEPDPRA